MSLLVTIDTDPGFAPKEALPAPERLISGNPSFKTWAQDASRQDKVLTGVWEATPGETHSIKGTTLSSVTSSRALSRLRRRTVRPKPTALGTAL